MDRRYLLTGALCVALIGCDDILGIRNVTPSGGTGGTGGASASSTSADTGGAGAMSTSTRTTASTTATDTETGMGGGAQGGCAPPPDCGDPPCYPELFASVGEPGVGMSTGVVTGMAAFGDTVYWGVKQGTTAALVATPSSGGASATLVAGLDAAPYRIAADASGVFWTSAEKLCARALLADETDPVDIGPCTAAKNDGFSGIGLDEGHVTWTVRAAEVCNAPGLWDDCCSTKDEGCVVFANKAPSSVFPAVQKGHLFPIHLGVDGAEVFWTDGGGPNKYFLRRCPIAQASCSPTSFVGGGLTQIPHFVLPLGDAVFYVDPFGIRRKSKAITDTADGELVAAADPSLSYLVTDGQAVYAGEEDGPIHRVDVAGGPDTVVANTMSAGAKILAVDGEYVYWAETGCILRAPK